MLRASDMEDLSPPDAVAGDSDDDDPITIGASGSRLQALLPSRNPKHTPPELLRNYRLRSPVAVGMSFVHPWDDMLCRVVD